MSDINETDINLCFELFDKDGSGSLTPTQAGVALRTLGRAPSNEELQELIGGSASITLDKFKQMVAKSSCPSFDEVMEAFGTFDTAGKGYIPVKELRHLMKTLGEGLSEDILDQMSQAAEPDSEQQVNYRHFVEVMMRIS